MKIVFKLNDRVSWIDSILNISTMRRRSQIEYGKVYRIDKTRVAVLPDSWAKEGKIEGMLKQASELTLVP